MTYNLVHEPWLHARLSSGGSTRATPVDALSRDDILSLETPRADFRAAQYYFLIGLAQSALAPKGATAWRKSYETPPEPSRLKSTLNAIAGSFILDDEARPFLQEAGLDREKGSEPEPITGLLVDAPGANTESLNKDLFVKRRAKGDAFCRPCAASALMTLQSSAGSGGAGYNTSLRGGGPLTTLVLGPSVRRTVWLNVLPADEWLGKDPPEAHRFPWLEPFKEKERTRTIDHVHPDVHYWSSPRRVLLQWDEVGRCALCGAPDKRLTTSFVTRPRGNTYAGAWKHPLTPVLVTKDKTPIPRKARAGAGYQHWLALAVGGEEGARPARVVGALHERREAVAGGAELVLWATGYEMNKATVEGWVEGRFPIHPLAPEQQPTFADHARRLVQAAREAAYLLRVVGGDTLTGGGESKRGVEALGNLEETLWVATESDFYEALVSARRAIEGGQGLEELRIRWLAVLHAAALDAYDSATSGATIGQRDEWRAFGNRAKLDRSLRAGKPAQTLGLAAARPKKGR